MKPIWAPFLLLVSAVILTACNGTNSETPTPRTSTPARQQPPLSGAPALLPPESPPSGAESEFSTDFSRHTVPYSEILSGGPSKDGIPSIDEPEFVGIAEADKWLKDKEPVVFLQIGSDVRAYPIQVLMWHEIANDTVGGVPVVVSFCPLCNTAIVFERAVEGKTLDFGTTGRLRFSNLIMYDRQTETWWQQATGDAIAGEMAGQQLPFRPASIIAWSAFRDAYLDGKVLSRDTGFNRAYGRNPYEGYDDISQSPFLYRGPQTPGKLPAMARVVTVDLDNESVAYPYDILQGSKVVNDEVGGTPIVLFWVAGTASALDRGSVADGRDVGAVTVFSRQVKGQTLTFSSKGNLFTDKETGSTWNQLGEATEGELKGERLSEVVAINHFWFSWAAFRPDTKVYTP